MKSSLLILVLFVGFSGGLRAQSAPVNYSDVTGHFIGESIDDFLRIEPDARQEIDVCRQRTDRKRCGELIAAFDRGQRAEVTTSGSVDFILDGGKLVKLTMLAPGSFESVAAQLTQKFGALSKKSTLSSRDSSGAKWDNQLYTWDNATVYVTLYQDNNPSLQDRRPLMVMESRGEHLLEDMDLPNPSPAASHPVSVAEKQ